MLKKTARKQAPATARPNGIGWAVVRLDVDGASWRTIEATGLTLADDRLNARRRR